jgi:hypothetical protein
MCGSQRTLNRIYDVPLSALSHPAAPAPAPMPRRSPWVSGSRARGCIGCHGTALEGRVFVDEPWLARVVAPDPTRIAREYSDAELERAIRRGVRRDGGSRSIHEYLGTLVTP